MFSEIIFFCLVLLNGFYAGTGFFVAMGGNPAIKCMTDQTFAEYWQHTDHFMAARMRVFGPLLLLVMLIAVIILINEYLQPSFWLMLTALLMLITDIVFTVSTNHPLNRVVQSWDAGNLPPDVQEIKMKITRAFDRRTIFMIGSFILVLLAVWLH